jgi:hypothetical protein
MLNMMSLKSHLWMFVMIACVYPSPAGATDISRPNVLVFLVDDLGYMDIGANNPNCFYDTPHIDALARSGMRFTDGYAANPVCSPTRYSLMTGKYPARVGATNFFSGRRSGRFNCAPLNDRMPLNEITLAQLLKTKGYATFFAGKWHLGPSEEYYPHYSNQGGIPGGAMREGDYKLVERFEDGRVHLYNLKDDIGERIDLAVGQPQRVAQMRASLHAWYKTVDAKFLQPKNDGPEPWRP